MLFSSQVQDQEILSATMFEFKWSPSEKKAARAAFDLALDRELKAIRQEAEALLQKSGDESSIWRVHDYLSEKRRDVDDKYSYRYSVLILVFSRLVSEGWLTVDDLSGIGTEKIEVIRQIISRR
jgi:Photoprotection regulator fluorescence recovery protein